jgi:LemA protein
LISGGVISWDIWEFPWIYLFGCGGYWLVSWLIIVVFTKSSNWKWLKNKWRKSPGTVVETFIILIGWLCLGVTTLGHGILVWSDPPHAYSHFWTLYYPLIVSIIFGLFAIFLWFMYKFWPWIFLTPYFAIKFYNSLKRQRNACQESWANIATEMRRRRDLYGKAIDVVRGYAKHEKELLTELVRLRSQNISQRGLIMLVEAYPELKAQAIFMALQEEIVRTENRINKWRLVYNANVKDLNDMVECFPSSSIAKKYGIEKMEYVQLAAE